MKRREFLKTSGYFVAVASLGGVKSGCGDDGSDDGGDGGADGFLFPQGVASGDPRDSSVVLWTRVESADGDTGDITVNAQVSDSDDFATLVVDETITIGSDSDHTLRLVVTGLAAATRYYYRFVVGDDTSPVGRTLTAPPPDDTAPVHLAWVSCQDFAAGTFGSYREMITDDESRAEDEQIQFVLHLGDFIYETIGGGFQGPLDDSFEPVELPGRTVAAFPSGGGSSGSSTFAQTVDDYRHLYKEFLSDPDLQEARARWPFIVTWDDHEFSNDSWQTQATFDPESSLNEPSQTRKVAANQAWFEYIPAQLSGAPGVAGVTQNAADFTPVTVEDTAYGEEDIDSDYQVTEANNLAALGSMTIYRSFRYGQNIELVVTDGRSYRSDHPIPEELAAPPVFFDPRAVVPSELVDVLDAGMTANGGDPPTMVQGFPNPRTATPPGTVLGPEQKAWWKETMTGSDATWKLWGNQAPFMRFLIRNQPAGILIFDRYMSSDSWDGYHSERV
ncbi:MAG: alkaline phosphatase D family protein, partial [Myxococcota bacterium]